MLSLIPAEFHVPQRQCNARAISVVNLASERQQSIVLVVGKMPYRYRCLPFGRVKPGRPQRIFVEIDDPEIWPDAESTTTQATYTTLPLVNPYKYEPKQVTSW